MKTRAKRKITAILAAAALTFTAIVLSACDDKNTGGLNQDILEKGIQVVSRNPGSGTRTTLVDLVPFIDDEGDDAVTGDAEIVGSTGQMLTVIESNELAIGYVTFGVLRETVKSLVIDGTEPTLENVLSGKYSLQRPFNLVKTGDLSDAAQDFWNFIFSDEGQAVIAERGHIPYNETGTSSERYAFETNGAAGTIAIGGATSMEPGMQLLINAYESLADTKAKIELNAIGSGAGELNTLSGVFDIGMVSREVESNQLDFAIMAIDAIAIIVHPANPVEKISMKDLSEVFKGEITAWGELA
ncbi:MAG: substrate-binding domain-containing protein [Oscillospiraceae bacterium]|nr:substrate-binding domain-containing protein [Oscillospiraceae bacterium]